MRLASSWPSGGRGNRFIWGGLIHFNNSPHPSLSSMVSAFVLSPVVPDWHGIEVAEPFMTYIAKMRSIFESRNNSSEVFEQLTFLPAFVVPESLSWAGARGLDWQSIFFAFRQAGSRTESHTVIAINRKLELDSEWQRQNC
jgi:hypothetical protein